MRICSKKPSDNKKHIQKRNFVFVHKCLFFYFEHINKCGRFTTLREDIWVTKIVKIDHFNQMYMNWCYI